MTTIQESVLAEFVWVDAERMGGVACFKGTRVPIETLFSWLAGGHDLEEILVNFPSVKKEQAVAVLNWSMLKAVEESGALALFTR
jgi:uncharacterized protein (DUF433 family)